MNQQQTMSTLQELGYQHNLTVSRKWTDAFFLRRDETTLVVLFRLGGVDLFVTPLPPEALANHEGRFSIRAKDPGNVISEFFYIRSDRNVHETILQNAFQFTHAGTLDQELPTKSGISRGDLARELRQAARLDSDEAIYEAVSPGDGTAGYVGDGMWIHAAGRWEDTLKGRIQC